MKKLLCLVMLLLFVGYTYSQQYVTELEPKIIVINEKQDVIYYHKYTPREIHIYDNQVGTNRSSTISLNQEDWKQTIWFREDQYKLNKTYNHVSLHNIGEFLLEHPCTTILITGYASKRHGSYQYNQQLAAKRCYSVRDYLVDYYSINPKRIYIKIRGTNNPEYYVDKWNQCVIINKLKLE